MRNKHAGDCYVCGGRVEPGTGHFERHQGGWRVKHALVPGHGRVTCAEAANAATRGPAKPMLAGGIAVAVLLAGLGVAFGSGQSTAMTACLKTHSQDTCVTTLNR